MKKIDLGQAVQILANLGVIAGIVFLALEIRQSNTQSANANLFEQEGQQTEWMYTVGGDAESANIYYEGLHDFDQLAPVDQMRFDLLMRSQLMRLEAGREADAGLGLNRGEAMRTRLFEALFEQKGFRQWWDYTDRRLLPAPLANGLEEHDPETR